MSRCFLLIILKESDIFAGLFKSRDKPQNRTADSNYAFFMGGKTFDKTVTERFAMQMIAMYSCACILSEAVAGLPLHLYKAAVIAFRKLLPKKDFLEFKRN